MSEGGGRARDGSPSRCRGRWPRRRLGRRRSCPGRRVFDADVQGSERRRHGGRRLRLIPGHRDDYRPQDIEDGRRRGFRRPLLLLQQLPLALAYVSVLTCPLPPAISSRLAPGGFCLLLIRVRRGPVAARRSPSHPPAQAEPSNPRGVRPQPRPLHLLQVPRGGVRRAQRRRDRPTVADIDDVGAAKAARIDAGGGVSLVDCGHPDVLIVENELVVHGG